MAFFAEKWTAADEEDYIKASGVTKADAYRGVAARISAAQTENESDPTAAKASAATHIIIGAITYVGNSRCKVVKSGRFVLQAASAYVAGDFGKKIAATTTAGKAEASAASGAAALALPGELAIIGGGEDTSTGGIGDFYLVEKL